MDRKICVATGTRAEYGCDLQVADYWADAQEEKLEVVKNFHHLEKLKYSPHLLKIFTEKGLYMLATIIKSKVATNTTLQIKEVIND